MTALLSSVQEEVIRKGILSSPWFDTEKFNRWMLRQAHMYTYHWQVVLVYNSARQEQPGMSPVRYKY